MEHVAVALSRQWPVDEQVRDEELHKDDRYVFEIPFVQ